MVDTLGFAPRFEDSDWWHMPASASMRCGGGHGRDTRLLGVVFIIKHIVLMITGSRILRKQLLRVNEKLDCDGDQFPDECWVKA